jgi:hypothetical protein
MCIDFLFPETLLASPTFVFNGYRGLFPRGYSVRGARLIPHLHIVTRLGMSGAMPLLPHCAFLACTGTSAPLYVLRVMKCSFTINQPFFPETSDLCFMKIRFILVLCRIAGFL